MSGTCALVVGVSEYDSPLYAHLPGAEVDRQRTGTFLTDPERGAVGVSRLSSLSSPTINEVREELGRSVANARKESSTLFIYFSGHAQSAGSNGLYLICRDTDPTNLSLTALSLRQLAGILAEHNILGSITVLDACNAGAAGVAAADIAINQLWQGESALAEGHFILAACGPNERARETFSGGRFTTALLEQVDAVGRERPYDQTIAVETLATALVSNEVLQQRPLWTGIAISSRIAFSKNPFWDSGAKKPATALSAASLSPAERDLLLGIARAYAAPMTHVGTSRAWAAEVRSIFLELADVAVGPQSKALVVSRLAEAVAHRVAAFGESRDQIQLIEALPAAAVALGRCGALDGEEIRQLAFYLSEVADKFRVLFSEWAAQKGWRPSADGPSAIALGPIRFWDTLGRAALLALACRTLAMKDKEHELASDILGLVRDNPRLHRTEWAGQYADMGIVIGYVSTLDQPLAREICYRLLESHSAYAKEGRAPAPASLSRKELGTYLADMYLPPDVGQRRARRQSADEGVPFLLMLLANTGETDIRLAQCVAQCAEREVDDNFYLYVPKSIEAQFEERMSQCEIRHWVRKSPQSVAKMLTDLRDLSLRPLTSGSSNIRAEMFSSFAAARLFRNRSCFGVASAIGKA